MTPRPSGPAIRCRVSFDESEGLRILIPARIHRGDVVVGGILAATGLIATMGWLSVEGLAFLSGRQDPPSFAPPSWLVLIGLVGLFGLFILGIRLRALRCREVIVIDGYRMTMANEGYPFRPRISWTLALTRIRNLRYSPERIPGQLSETESRRLIKTIKDHFKIEDDRDEPLPVERF